MARRKIPRKRMTMWLRLDKRDEVELLYDIIPELKKRQQFSSAVRDGIRLVWELRQGKTDTLLKLFPFVATAFQPAPDNSQLIDLITSMMHSSPSPAASTFIAPKMPTFDTAPVVGHLDESRARELSIANALASLDDF